MSQSWLSWHCSTSGTDFPGHLCICNINVPRPVSVQFSHSVMSDSLQPHGLQHARLPSPSPTPRAYSNSGPLSQWCHPTISSSVVPFSSCLQSFPASGFFPLSYFFASGSQSIGVSASALIPPMNIQDWFPLGWTGWISLQSKGLSRVFSGENFESISTLMLRFLYRPTLTSINDYFWESLNVVCPQKMTWDWDLVCPR